MGFMVLQDTHQIPDCLFIFNLLIQIGKLECNGFIINYY